VIYLAHTNADEMADTLRALGLVRGGASGAGSAGARPGAGASSGSAAPVSGDVRIAADKVSNAIVVFAGGQDFLMVRDLVGKLDLPRRQVYVEAAVLDLSVLRTHELGLSAHLGQSVSNGSAAVAGSTSSSSLTSLVTDAASLAKLFTGGGLTTGVFGQSFTWNGITVPSFGVVLKALESTKDVHVISQPHLLTMDNVKASLSVGQSIPFPTQSLSSVVSGTASTALAATYQRQDVALKLEMTPHLNDSESIRLEIDSEISDVPDGQASGAAGGPTTNKRTIKTAVVVADGETVVLGGLQKESESETVEKTPILGDIPILGMLFRTRSKQRQKQDLVVCITPYVIRGPQDLRRIFERKQMEQREFTALFDRHPNFDAPVDYGRSRGLLVEIDRTARAAEREVALLRESERGRKHPPVEGEVQ
jgi:general secretion pathway protein D